MFVIYGSLVPLKYEARSFDDAWAAFQHIPFLKLGIESRADWISNGVLYLPVGFLTGYLLNQTFHQAPKFVTLVTSAIFSVALAVGVEFTQLYFPQRTVSLNDILAECIGSGLGLVSWFKYGNWFQTLLKSFSKDRQSLRARALESYAFAYIAFSFFPFDVLLSWAEIEAKIHSSSWGWFVAGNAPRLFLLGSQMLVEVLLALPFGFLLNRFFRPYEVSLKKAALAGFMLGVLIETVQFFMGSGITQGLSIVSRAFGVCCGLALCKHQSKWNSGHIASFILQYTLPLSTIYLLALLEVNGWFGGHWQGLQAASARLEEVKFIPFYYHYFSSEARALLSLAAVCFSYIPLALLNWANRRSPQFSFGLALILSTFIEASKLFLQSAHVDPTNILLATLTSWIAVNLIYRLTSEQGQPAPLPKPTSIDSPKYEATQHHRKLPVWLIATLGATSLWAITFPAFPVFVCLVLMTCATAIWHRPAWIFGIIPAALPMFDLAPWSGRFYLDEFDALLGVGLAVAYTRTSTLQGSRPRRDGLLAILAVCVMLSFMISTVRGMLPFQLPDANSFNNYYSPYNALRIVKGVAWAFLAFGLLKRISASGIDARKPFAWGMTLGLGFTVAVILWERVAFSGLWNFSSNYRVTGPFSAMHNGGAYIECFLAGATPYLLMLLLEKRHWLTKLAGVALLLTTTYALMVTFSRNGYSAFAVGVGIVLLGTLLKSKRFARTGMIASGLAIAMLLVAIPIYKGDFAQSRVATVGTDLGVRQAHWEDALSIRDPDWGTTLFGMGLGRYPETSYWRSTLHPRSGTYRMENEKGNTYLRLGSGDSIYVEQLVSVESGGDYVLKLDVRPNKPNSKITVPICEKWMLTSYNCIWEPIELGKEFGNWQRIEKNITTKQLLSSPWYSRRSVKLSLYAGTSQAIIDVDNVRLENEHGTNLVTNGTFSEGMDNWFFASDSHLQWHVKTMFYGVVFDQGWFGLIAMVAFFILAIKRAVQNVYRGDVAAGPELAALMSFLTVGAFDTLIDSPRFLMLLLLLAGFCGVQPRLHSKESKKIEVN